MAICHSLAPDLFEIIEDNSGFSVTFEQCSNTTISCATQDSKKHEH